MINDWISKYIGRSFLAYVIMTAIVIISLKFGVDVKWVVIIQGIVTAFYGFQKTSEKLVTLFIKTKYGKGEDNVKS